MYTEKNVTQELDVGHRHRLRDKFLQGGLNGFLDYEIVELLLTLGTPRKDCKMAAKEALKRFKMLRGVLEAEDDELLEIKGIGPHNIFGIKLVQEVAMEGKIRRRIRKLEEHGFKDLPVCIAKTQYSLSSDDQALGRPKDFILIVTDASVSAGAGFVVVYCGDIMTMPGLPKIPAAEKIDINDEGEIIGLS